MITYDEATAFFPDNLGDWVPPLNNLYIDSTPWEACTADTDLIDMLHKPIIEGDIYYQRPYHDHKDPLILSNDSMKFLLFLLFEYNLGLERFLREDLPRAIRNRQQSIDDGTHSPIDFNKGV